MRAGATTLSADYSADDNSCSVVVKHGEFSWDAVLSPPSSSGAGGTSGGAGKKSSRATVSPGGRVNVSPDQTGLLLSPTAAADDDSGPSRSILRDINFRCGAGDLVCVVGQVGCGKSSLIQVHVCRPSAGVLAVSCCDPCKLLLLLRAIVV